MKYTLDGYVLYVTQRDARNANQRSGGLVVLKFFLLMRNCDVLVLEHETVF